MLSRRWIVICLMILSILLLAFIGYRFDTPPDTRPRTAVPGFDPAAIDRIEIGTARASLSLQRSADGWTILEPVRWPASRANVERLFRIVDIGGSEPLASADIDLAKLGLDDPVARIELGDTRLRFGTTNNIGGRRYTMIDATVFLLPDVQLPLIAQGLSGFVDRRLLPPRFELTALSLPGLELRRDGNGWQATGERDISGQRVEALVSAWQGLEASRIDAFDTARMPLDRIGAELAHGEHLEFVLLSTEPEIVIANPALGLQYHFRLEHHERLISPAADENPA